MLVPTKYVISRSNRIIGFHYQNYHCYCFYDFHILINIHGSRKSLWTTHMWRFNHKRKDLFILDEAILNTHWPVPNSGISLSIQPDFDKWGFFAKPNALYKLGNTEVKSKEMVLIFFLALWIFVLVQMFCHGR